MQKCTGDDRVSWPVALSQMVKYPLLSGSVLFNIHLYLSKYLSKRERHYK